MPDKSRDLSQKWMMLDTVHVQDLLAPGLVCWTSVRPIDYRGYGTRRGLKQEPHVPFCIIMLCKLGDLLQIAAL